MEKVKISDVAKAAGVSLATVSRVLSNGGPVKAETRERILRVIEELNYQPNALARQLRTQKTKTMIVIVPNIANYLFSEVIFGIEAAASSNGYQVMIAEMHNQPSIEMHYINAIRQKQIDGIISMSANMTQKLMQQISGGYPIVMALQSFQSDTIPSVSIDNSAAAKAMATHLIRMGRKQIVHLTNEQLHSPYSERLEGYKSALASNGLEVEDELISYGEASIQGGYDQMQGLIDKGVRFDAVFAAGDTMAIGAMKALKSHGYRVPEDIAVVGFDDIELASFWDPSLTTIRQPAHQIGQCAFRKLLAQMNGENISQLKDVLPYELVIRESCGYFS